MKKSTIQKNKKWTEKKD